MESHVVVQLPDSRGESTDPQYTYRPLGSNSIRLLHIIDPSKKPPKCALSHARLDEVSTSFTALSYTWDDQTCDHDIVISPGDEGDRAVLKVTKKIYEALPYLESHFPGQRWWIDAVCINQIDLDEVHQQLPLMKQIFTGADSVVVWLGKASPNLQQALKALPDILASLEHSEAPTFIGANSPADLGLPDKRSEIWKGIREFFRMSYFQRVWTMQEVILPSRGLQFVCGDTVLDWTDFVRIAEGFDKHQLWPLTMQDMEFPTVASCQADGEVSFLLLVQLINHVRKGHGLDVFLILAQSRPKKATRSHDMVFGLLALFEEHIQQSIDVDYRKPVAQVYLAFSRLLFDTYHQSWILLYWASSQEKRETLPSWSPDWGMADALLPLTRIYTTGLWEGAYCQVSTMNDELLSLMGLRIDQVAKLASSSWIVVDLDPATGNKMRSQNLIWCSECHDLTKEAYGRDDDDVLDACRRTIIADSMDNRRCRPEAASRGYHAMYHLLKTGSFFPATSKSALNLMFNYLGCCNLICSGRTFFRTSEGRVGVGPSQTRQGDIIIGIPESPFPFILREDVVDGQKLYELVGVAYVHGVMWGELVPRMREASNLEGFVLR